MSGVDRGPCCSTARQAGGKSTIVRRLLENADMLGPPLRVLRISVADFDYLRPSVIEAVVRLLLPDGIVIDDFDRLVNADKLLDFLEAARLLGERWTDLDDEQRARLATWPAVFVEELAGLLEVLSGLVVGDEIAELQKRVDPPPAKLIAIEAAPAAGATT